MTDDLDLLERELGDQLRRTFRAAASAAPQSVALRRRRHLPWRRIAGIGFLGGVALAGGAAWLAHDPGQIERVPVENALLDGQVPSGHWYLLPTGDGTPAWGTEGCQYPGVSLIVDRINQPGQEWNGGGVDYGEANDSTTGCAIDQETWLGDPTRFNLGYQRLGFERASTPWGGFAAMHPSIAAVRVETDTQAPFEVTTVARDDAPSGPRYVAFSIPSDTTRVTVTLLDADGTVVGDPRVTHL